MANPSGSPASSARSIRPSGSPSRSTGPPDPDDVETLVTLAFRDRDGSTAVALEQGAFKTEARRELHRDGWGESFDRLERLLAGRV